MGSRLPRPLEKSLEAEVFENLVSMEQRFAVSKNMYYLSSCRSTVPSMLESLQASRSDLVALDWGTNGIAADFFLPNKEAHLLRVSFERPCIIRVLDEMHPSTEKDDIPNIGLVPEHFAYLLEGAAFAHMQSGARRDVNAPVKHYRFITGWACLDVLTSATPGFATVKGRRSLYSRKALILGKFPNRKESSPGHIVS